MTGIGSKIVTTIFGLVAIGLAVRSLGNIEYGIIATLAGISGIFGFLDFGIGNATIYDVSQHYAKRDYLAIRVLVANTLVFLLGMGLLVCLVIVPLTLLAPAALLFNAPGVDVGEVRSAIVVFAVSTALAIPFSLGSRIALGIQKGTLNNFVSLISGACVLLMVALGVWAGAPLLYFIAAFILAPSVINGIQTLWILSREKGLLRPQWDSVSIRGVSALFGKGLPFMALAFAGAATYQTDSLVIIYILGAAGAATFGVLLKLFGGVTSLFTGGLQQMWASVAHALAEGDMVWVRKTFKFTFLITMTLYLIAAAGLLVLGPAVIAIWAGNDVVPGFELVLAFAIWNTYNFAMSQLSMLLNGANRVRVQALTACIMAVVNLPLTILLTQAVGLPGPLYASLISHVACVGIPTFVMVHRLLRVNRPVTRRNMDPVMSTLLPAGRHWSR